MINKMNNLALHNSSIREHIHHLISDIIPYDDVEQEHINDTRLWIESGAPIFGFKNLMLQTNI
jgi:hypothetical protein